MQRPRPAWPGYLGFPDIVVKIEVTPPRASGNPREGGGRGLPGFSGDQAAANRRKLLVALGGGGFDVLG